MSLAIVILLLITTPILFFYSYSIYKKRRYSNSLNPTLHNADKDLIILWDIHGVLFEKSMLEWLYVLLTYPHIFTVLKKLDRKTVSILAKYCGKKMGILKEEITNQELINYAKVVNNQALIDLTTRISCAYKPKHKTIALVKQLHENGYAQHIGSNIGKVIFEIFAPQYPSIFNYFSYIHIINTNEASTKIKKPNKEFFTSYLAVHKKQPENILFIDDRWDNIKAARACGMHAIYFKNATQLLKEFHTLGLLFEKKNNVI